MINVASDDLRTLVLIKFTKSLIENSESYAMFKLEKMFSSGEMNNYLEKKRTLAEQEEEERILLEEKERDKKEKIKEKVKEKLNYTPSIMSLNSEETPLFVQPKERASKEPQKSRTTIKTHHKRIVRQPEKKISQLRAPTPKPNPRRPQRPGMAIPADDLPEHLRYLRPTRTDKPKELELKKLTPFIKDRNVKSIEIEGPDQVVYVKGTMGKKPTGVKLSKEEIDQILDTFSKVGKVPRVEGLFKVATSNLILTAMVSKSIGSRFIIKKM